MNDNFLSFFKWIEFIVLIIHVSIARKTAAKRNGWLGKNNNIVFKEELS